jgi:energy-coupling factor transporter transmembrane protein EcfT
MNKKLILGFIAVYVVMNLTNFIIHMYLLNGIYHSEAVARIMRPESDGTIWIYFVTTIFSSFFFTLIFSKGYEGKGIGEGLRFGLYTGLMICIPMAYDSYASYPLPYTLALQWFCYGLAQYLLLGVVVAMVYGKKQ